MRVLFLFLICVLVTSSCYKAEVLEPITELKVVNETDANLYDVLAADDIDFGFVAAHSESKYKVASDLSGFKQGNLQANIESIFHSSLNFSIIFCGPTSPDSIFGEHEIIEVSSGKYQIVLKEIDKEHPFLLVEFSKVQ